MQRFVLVICLSGFYMTASSVKSVQHLRNVPTLTFPKENMRQGYQLCSLRAFFPKDYGRSLNFMIYNTVLLLSQLILA